MQGPDPLTKMEPLPAAADQRSGGRALAKALALGTLVAVSLVPFLLGDHLSFVPYYAPLLPCLFVGYAFRSWAALLFALVPLAFAIAFGQPAGYDPETGSEMVVPEWFAFLFVTPYNLAAIACGIGVDCWVARRRGQPPARSQ
jgi:hypothetical protein